MTQLKTALHSHAQHVESGKTAQAPGDFFFGENQGGKRKLEECDDSVIEIKSTKYFLVASPT